MHNAVDHEFGVVMIVPSLRNPFVDAWCAVISNLPAKVVVLVDNTIDHYRGELKLDADAIEYTHDTSGEVYDWASRVEEYLGGRPDIVFYWWGFDSLRRTRLPQQWRHAHVSLCVDTFPNASRLLTEVRESLFALVDFRLLDSLVVTSREMLSSLEFRFRPARQLPSVEVVSPFPIASHRDCSQLETRGPLKLCFAGRSDYLHTGSRRMAKDDLGSWLARFIERGSEVHIQRPDSESKAQQLLARGYHFYEHISRAGMLNGEFSAMLSRFDGNLIYYNVQNSTIRRRVGTGLSTRFATGICSSAPIVVPNEAHFARRFLHYYRIGLASENHSDIEAALRSRQSEFRQNWRTRHHEWTGELAAERLKVVWGLTTARGQQDD